MKEVRKMSKKNSIEITEFDKKYVREAIRRAEILEKNGFSDTYENLESSKSESVKLCNMLKNIIETELTPKQRIYVYEYYWTRLSSRKIAEKYRLAPSTVTRTIARANQTIFRYLRFYFDNTLKYFM
jgi:predicted DNA-binding protein YlxM (UPF0122 family)